MDFHGSLLSRDFKGFTWISMDFHLFYYGLCGFTWIYIDFSGFTWIYLDYGWLGLRSLGAGMQRDAAGCTGMMPLYIRFLGFLRSRVSLFPKLGCSDAAILAKVVSRRLPGLRAEASWLAGWGWRLGFD